MQLKQKRQSNKRLLRIKFILGLLLCANIFSFGQTDFDRLKPYIPYANSSLEIHPVITIRVHVHVIQRYKNDAQNIESNNLKYIEQQFEWINGMYSNFSKPTLLPENGETYFIPDSRIRFRLDTVLFHIDSTDWDRIRTVINMGGGAPWQVDTVDLTSNEIGIQGSLVQRFRKKDSIAIINSTDNNGRYSIISVRQELGRTFLKLKEKLHSDAINGELSYYMKQDRNCSQDIWRKYTNSNKNALHVFYTGSSQVSNSFGCGPSPFFLNVSNIDEKQGFALALLSGHELGHCIGLNHTNHPQFSDLPKADKFGWIMCNDVNTSNNIMGYNRCRKYLSPLQVGHVHQRYSTNKKLIKITTANEYDTAYNVNVWDDTEWNKTMVIKGDLIVRKRKTLVIHKNVSMASGSAIYIEKGAKLIVDGATITNHFDAYWNGVVICKSYNRKNKKPKKLEKYGKVELLNEAKLLQYSVKQISPIPNWNAD